MGRAEEKAGGLKDILQEKKNLIEESYNLVDGTPGFDFYLSVGGNSGIAGRGETWGN